MIHPDLAGVKKSEIKAVIGKKFKATEDRIAVFGVRAKFGGGRSSGFVTVYDDLDARKKYDNKANLARVSGFTTIFERESIDLGALWQPRSRDCSNGAFDLFAFLCYFINYIYFNRTKLLSLKRRLPVNCPRNLRARERESRVPPSPRSRPASRRSEHPAYDFGKPTCLPSRQTAQRNHLVCVLTDGYLSTMANAIASSS